MNPIIRAFCHNKDQEAALKGYGIAAKSIWMDSRGAESLKRCLSTYRGRPGMLILAQDLRAFGTTKKAVSAVMADLEKAQIRVIDIAHPEDTTVASLVQRANVALSNTNMDKRTARRRGARGGVGKGIAAQQNRNSAIPNAFVQRVVDHPEIPWRVKLEVLGPQFTASTLRRHHGGMKAK
jgi:hypothetical protein